MGNKSFRSGFIAIVGRPNVGKSTLLNALIGEKLAAVTDKPQTTRHRILGIKTLPGGQLLFVDTPGLHKPRKSLNEMMVEIAQSSIDDVDLILFVIEPDWPVRPDDTEILQQIFAKKKRVILVINKVDRVLKTTLLPLIESYHRSFPLESIVPISAKKGSGLLELEKIVLERLPEGPHYYPDDQTTDLTERFLATEVIREKAMDFLREELPYSLAVVIDSYQEPKPGDRKKVVRIEASLVVERESQKGIVIGEKGSFIKRIGEAARQELEQRLGEQVFLKLLVRVKADWTQDPQKVKELAYS